MDDISKPSNLIYGAVLDNEDYLGWSDEKKQAEQV